MFERKKKKNPKMTCLGVSSANVLKDKPLAATSVFLLFSSKLLQQKKMELCCVVFSVVVFLPPPVLLIFVASHKMA